MDLRKWFLLNEKPTAKELATAIDGVPCSDFRSPSVMRVFLAGMRCRLKLTDEAGQPTEALRVMVSQMEGAELCTEEQLPKEERRNFSPVKKGTLLDVLVRRWYIRGISERLRFDGAATGGYGWAWFMFRRTNGYQGLRCKRITELVDGVKKRRTRYVVECPSAWELNDSVYEGLWRYTCEHHTRRWDSYGFLAGHLAADHGGSPAAGVRPPEAAGATQGA